MEKLSENVLHTAVHADSLRSAFVWSVSVQEWK